MSHNEVCLPIKVHQAPDIVENSDFGVIWLRKQRYYSPLKRSEISEIIEMSLEGSVLMGKVGYMGLNID